MGPSRAGEVGPRGISTLGLLAGRDHPGEGGQALAPPPRHAHEDAVMDRRVMWCQTGAGGRGMPKAQRNAPGLRRSRVEEGRSWHGSVDGPGPRHRSTRRGASRCCVAQGSDASSTTQAARPGRRRRTTSSLSPEADRCSTRPMGKPHASIAMRSSRSVNAKRSKRAARAAGRRTCIPGWRAPRTSGRRAARLGPRGRGDPLPPPVSASTNGIGVAKVYGFAHFGWSFLL